VDLEILKVRGPEKGDDLLALQKYTGVLGELVEFDWVGSRELKLSAQVGEREGIGLAIAYSPFWRVSETSIPIEIEKDPLGMIVVRPKEAHLGSKTSARQEGILLTARLRFDPKLDLIGGGLISTIALYILLRKPQSIDKIVSLAERFVGRESELDRTSL
jgi:hypothetical protein